MADSTLRVRQAAALHRQAAATVDAAAAALENTVHGAGVAWGDSTFAPLYQAVLGHALGALGSYVQQVGDAALNLAVLAGSVTAADAVSAASLAHPDGSRT